MRLCRGDLNDVSVNFIVVQSANFILSNHYLRDMRD
jgi:hypothetical protein